MFRFVKSLSTAILSMLVLASAAHAEVEYIWDDAGGFKSAKNCEVTNGASTRFRVTEHIVASSSPFEQVYTLGGQHYSYLLDNSLVKVTSWNQKYDNLPIQVMGVSPNSAVNTSKGFLDWNDQGYFKPDGLKDLSGYEIEVLNLPSNFKNVLGDTGEAVSGTLWKVATQDDHQVSFMCGDTPYLAFDVFSSDKATPIARVGVDFTDVAVFRSVRVRLLSDHSAKPAKVTAKPAVVRPPKPSSPSESDSSAHPQTPVVDKSPNAPAQPVEFIPLPRPRPEILLTPVTSSATPAPSAPVTTAPVATPAAPATPAVDTTSGTLDVSMAASLFGSDELPQISHGDAAYSRPPRGQPDKSVQCRTAWKLFRKQAVQKQAIHVELSTLLKNASANHLSPTFLKKTLAAFLANQSQIPQQHFISIIDFDKRSDVKRLFTVSLDDGSINSYLVAAGRGSDPSGNGYARVFGNEFGKHRSSLGCYIVAGDFEGDHGLSIMLHGFESTNDYACEREVEFHTEDSYVGTVPGRSLGCFAIRSHDQKTIYSRVRSGLICSYYDAEQQTLEQGAPDSAPQGSVAHHRSRRRKSRG